MANAQLQSVLDHIDKDFDNSLERLFSLLRIKSISADPAFAGDCKAAAEHLAKDIASFGVATEVRPTAGHPAVVGKTKADIKAGGRPHVIFYGHYDVQPVDPLELWHRPPFEPVVTDHTDGRKIIVARGAEDDKGQVMTFVEACRAWKKVTGSLPIDITFLIEGEEEVGSKNFVPFVETNKDEFKADYVLVCDAGMWDPNTPAITTALRGLLYEEVKITAASRDLHSGVFGGTAMNPIRVLTKILGGLFDDDNRITIPGFYDGVKDTPPEILEQWKKLDFTPETFLKPIGLSIPAGEKGRLLVEQASTRPTCDVNGIWGGYIGEGSKTVIPSHASAKVSFRLVQGQNPQKIRKAFRDYVTARIPGDCKVEFGDHSAAPAVALDWNMKPLAAARKALTEEWGKETVLMGSGASIPIVADFKRALGLDSLLVGFGLDDDNIHSPNEKYDLRSFQKGIRSWARILAALAEVKS
ncbi:M20/M25/M40 family metallo-hydrolase [Bradyrhizobium diazoefficiens]|uniref:M20/M25/M40 family metallo-hydrolase n=1 Tax=Bradyrhizobium diazoefficiens TaxID=1355477 RepID=UPI00190DB698|nr:M20/M25/M40 family metallo-hydrolase [Bradyrhizobium diazoefficiens]MBK3664413.1 M20/M25/M40 family metallo-hydrolase [Bradyrhizobium diazoefficiens]